MGHLSPKKKWGVLKLSPIVGNFLSMLLGGSQGQDPKLWAPTEPPGCSGMPQLSRGQAFILPMTPQ